jgi:hypothetical protein
MGTPESKPAAPLNGTLPSDVPLPPCPKPTFPEQDENGVDLSLIRENLRLSPVERLRRGDEMRRQMLLIRENARRVVA